MIVLSSLLLIGIGGGALAVIDGINRVRGQGQPVLSVLEVIVAGSFLASFFLTDIPGGSLTLAVATLVVAVLQLVVRGASRATEVVITLVATSATGVWLALANDWLVIPGVN